MRYLLRCPLAVHVTLMLLVFPVEARSEANTKDSKHGQRLLMKGNTNAGESVQLKVRDQGHIHGQPFIVEMYVNCKDEGPPVLVDSVSVCDLSPKSVKANRWNTAYGLKVKYADVTGYNEMIARGSLDARVQCKPQTDILTFALDNRCP